MSQEISNFAIGFVRGCEKRGMTVAQMQKAAADACEAMPEAAADLHCLLAMDKEAGKWNPKSVGGGAKKVWEGIKDIPGWFANKFRRNLDEVTPSRVDNVIPEDAGMPKSQSPTYPKPSPYRNADPTIGLPLKEFDPDAVLNVQSLDDIGAVPPPGRNVGNVDEVVEDVVESTAARNVDNVDDVVDTVDDVVEDVVESTAARNVDDVVDTVDDVVDGSRLERVKNLPPVRAAGRTLLGGATGMGGDYALNLATDGEYDSNYLAYLLGGRGFFKHRLNRLPGRTGRSFNALDRGVDWTVTPSQRAFEKTRNYPDFKFKDPRTYLPAARRQASTPIDKALYTGAALATGRDLIDGQLEIAGVGGGGYDADFKIMKAERVAKINSFPGGLGSGTKEGKELLADIEQIAGLQIRWEQELLVMPHTVKYKDGTVEKATPAEDEAYDTKERRLLNSYHRVRGILESENPDMAGHRVPHPDPKRREQGHEKYIPGAYDSVVRDLSDHAGSQIARQAGPERLGINPAGRTVLLPPSQMSTSPEAARPKAAPLEELPPTVINSEEKFFSQLESLSDIMSNPESTLNDQLKARKEIADLLSNEGGDAAAAQLKLYSDIMSNPESTLNDQLKASKDFAELLSSVTESRQEGTNLHPSGTPGIGSPEGASGQASRLGTPEDVDYGISGGMKHWWDNLGTKGQVGVVLGALGLLGGPLLANRGRPGLGLGSSTLGGLLLADMMGVFGTPGQYTKQLASGLGMDWDIGSATANDDRKLEDGQPDAARIPDGTTIEEMWADGNIDKDELAAWQSRSELMDEAFKLDNADAIAMLESAASNSDEFRKDLKKLRAPEGSTPEALKKHKTMVMKVLMGKKDTSITVNTGNWFTNLGATLSPPKGKGLPQEQAKRLYELAQLVKL